MGIKYYTIEIKGNHSHWSIPVGKLPKQTIEDWKADGLYLTEIHSCIPLWVAKMGYIPTSIYCFFEDIFHFQNPFKS